MPGFFIGYPSDEVIATMPVFGPGYEVSFEFYLHSRDQVDTLGYGWLIGVKGGGVAFYEIDGRMAIWFGFNKFGDNNGDTLDQWRYPYGNGLGKTVELKKWYHVSVSSIKEGGKVRCEKSVKY